MLPSTPALSVLLVAITLTAVSESAPTVVKVDYKGTAVLPCSERCSGVISWTHLTKSSDNLVQCDQNSCRSVKEGYQMIYNQYLHGDFSLIITEADFSKKGYYTCNCDGTYLNDVQLQIEPLKRTVQVKPGESLRLNLYVSDRVEVIYNSTDPAGPSSHQICTVERLSVQLNREYSERASVSSDLELRGVKESDSGVYTVRDTFNNEIICIYTVIVHGQGAALPGWVFAVFGVVCVVLVVVIVVQWRKIKGLQRESARKRNPQNRNPVNEVGNNNGPESVEMLDYSNNQEHT